MFLGKVSSEKSVFLSLLVSHLWVYCLALAKLSRPSSGSLDCLKVVTITTLEQSAFQSGHFSFFLVLLALPALSLCGFMPLGKC